MSQEERYPTACEPKQCGSDETIVGNLTRKQKRLQEQLDTVTNALNALKTDAKLTGTLELVFAAQRC